MKVAHDFFAKTFGMIFEKLISPFRCDKQENSKEKHVTKKKNRRRKKCGKNSL